MVPFKRFIQKAMGERYREGWVFRGQQKIDWTLDTSFRRFCNNHNVAFSVARFEQLLNDYVRSISNFELKSLEKEMSLFEKMAFAQHHGLPTLLLDWTKSPYIALYFAAAGMLQSKSDFSKEEYTVRVWALNTAADAVRQVAMDHQADISLERIDRPLYIQTPSTFSRRIARQLGSFTFSSFNAPLDVTIPDRQVLTHFDVEIKPQELFDHLRRCGIVGSSLFDNLDYVAEDVAIDYLIRRSS